MALRKIEIMYQLFGKTEGHCCRECSNLEKVRANDRPLSKCKVYGCTNSEASDWTQRYQACGMFNKPWNKEPIIRQGRQKKTGREEDPIEPIEGQITMEDLS